MGVGLLSLLTLISVITKTSLSVVHGVPSGGAETPGQGSTDYWNKVYDKPWTRIQPYLVGIALGYFMMRRPNLRMRPVGTQYII